MDHHQRNGIHFPAKHITCTDSLHMTSHAHSVSIWESHKGIPSVGAMKCTVCVYECILIVAPMRYHRLTPNTALLCMRVVVCGHVWSRALCLCMQNIRQHNIEEITTN